MNRHVLIVRADGLGDVVLAGPAVRAVAASGARITMLSSTRGEPAARRLPGVGEVIIAALPWSETSSPPMAAADMAAFAATLHDPSVDEAMILTSSHQSPLPTALLLRQAGVERIGGTTVGHPGSLLDVALRHDDDVHEVVRSLRVATAMGYALPRRHDGALRLRRRGRSSKPRSTRRPYVVVHPGASVAARTLPAEQWAAVVPPLIEAFGRVVVTGAAGERAVTAAVAAKRRGVDDLGGRLDLDGFLDVLDGADVVVSGNTGPAHLAAAVGTPVVSLFAPTVSGARWHPWSVPYRLLGRQDVPCAGCRAQRCPVLSQPRLAGVGPAPIVAPALEIANGPREAVAS